MKALFWSFILLFFFLGCGKEEKEVKNIITSTTSYLTQGNCQAAIDTISSIPFQSQNYLYVKAYASAYACRAGFSVVPFFENDLSKIGTPSILGGMARFSNASRMTESRSESFEDLQVAIDSLLYIGGIDRSRNPTPDRRRLNFSNDVVNDIHSQLLYLLLDQLGKYVRFYGNADADGEKGQGNPLSNQCFLTYQNFTFVDNVAELNDYFDNATTSSCNPVTDPSDVGHPSLMDGATIRIDRACQGIVLFNNFRVVLLEILEFLTDEFDVFDNIETAFTAFDTLVGQAINDPNSELTSMLSQNLCEETYASNPNAIQTFFVGIFETLLEGPP
jgi:hypothetical protein